MTTPVDTRSAVLRALSVRPGAGPSQVVALTGRGWGSVDHALHALQKQDRVRCVGEGRAKAFYRTDGGSAPALGLRGAPLRLLDAVLQAGGGTLGKLAESAGMPGAEASRIVAQLAQLGVVVTVRQGRTLMVLPGQPHRIRFGS